MYGQDTESQFSTADDAAHSIPSCFTLNLGDAVDEIASRMTSVAETYRSQVLEEMTSVARQRRLDLHPDEVSVLVSNTLPGMVIANAAVAGLPDSTLDRILGGTEPVLFVYLPEVELTSGVNIPAGCYTVTMDGRRRRAQLVDQNDKAIADIGLEVSAAPPSRLLARKAVVTDVDGPELCAEVCVKICFSVKIDVRGPFNPSIRVCIEIIVKI